MRERDEESLAAVRARERDALRYKYFGVNKSGKYGLVWQLDTINYDEVARNQKTSIVLTRRTGKPFVAMENSRDCDPPPTAPYTTLNWHARINTCLDLCSVDRKITTFNLSVWSAVTVNFIFTAPMCAFNDDLKYVSMFLCILYAYSDSSHPHTVCIETQKRNENQRRIDT